MPNLEDAILLATHAHKGQYDKVGQPYILHPLRVMLDQKTEEKRIVGVFHDIVEDTDITLDYLREQGYNERVIHAVDALTHREGESYDDYLKRIISDPLAPDVKLADLKDNMNILRLTELGEKDMRRLNKYLRAHAFITKEITSLNS